MDRTRRRPSFLAGMRRERTLFAFVGSFILLFGSLQSLAAAGHEMPGGWIICHGVNPDGVAGSTPDAPPRDCPMCIGGLCASVSASAKALIPHDFVLAGPASAGEAAAVMAAKPVMPTRPGSPPSIRAPPASV